MLASIPDIDPDLLVRFRAAYQENETLALQAFAHLVVAAELRRLATESNDTDNAAIVRDRMRNRAFDLEGP